MTQRELVKMWREKDIQKLMERTGKSESECRRIFNSFYRLSYREQRLIELENDERFYSRHVAWLDRENERNIKWARRLTDELKAYNLRVSLRGGYAHFDITFPDTSGVDTFRHGHYYN